MVGKPLTEFRFDDVKTIYDVLQKGLAISCKLVFLKFTK